MYPDLEALLYKAEQHYLQPLEIKLFKHHVDSLAQRLETYESLRELELDIFQPLADRLVTAFPQEPSQSLERVLKRWLTISRYCAMSMLLNNPELLQRRLLEWLIEVVQVEQMHSIEFKLCQLLQQQLKDLLSESQLSLIQPFLDQAQATLLGAKAPYELLV